MEDAETARKKRSKRIAYIIGGIAIAWYVASIFTVWH
jgi:hypothetical protein